MNSKPPVSSKRDRQLEFIRRYNDLKNNPRTILIKYPAIFAGLLAAVVGFVSGFFVGGISDVNSGFGGQPLSIQALLANILVALSAFTSISFFWYVFSIGKVAVSLLRGTIIGCIGGFFVPFLYIILAFLWSAPQCPLSTLAFIIFFTQLTFGFFSAVMGALGGFLFALYLKKRMAA